MQKVLVCSLLDISVCTMGIRGYLGMTIVVSYFCYVYILFRNTYENAYFLSA